MTYYPCPTCQTKTLYKKTNPFRPFCSERCKLIDLGEWASGGHRIEGKHSEDELFSEELKKMMNTDGTE